MSKIVDLPYVYQAEAIKRKGRKVNMFNVAATAPFEIDQLAENQYGVVKIECVRSAGTGQIRFSNKLYYDNNTGQQSRQPQASTGETENITLDEFIKNATDVKQTWLRDNGLLKGSKALRELQLFVLPVNIFEPEEDYLERVEEDSEPFKILVSDNKQHILNQTANKISESLTVTEDNQLLVKDERDYYLTLSMDNEFQNPVPTQAKLMVSRLMMSNENEVDKLFNMSMFAFPVTMLDALRIFTEKTGVKLNMEQSDSIEVSNVTEEMCQQGLQNTIHGFINYVNRATTLYAGKKGVPDYSSLPQDKRDITLHELEEWLENIKLTNNNFLTHVFLPHQIEEKQSQELLKTIYNMSSIWVESMQESLYNITHDMYAKSLSSKGFDVEKEPEVLRLSL